MIAFRLGHTPVDKRADGSRIIFSAGRGEGIEAAVGPFTGCWIDQDEPAEPIRILGDRELGDRPAGGFACKHTVRHVKLIEHANDVVNHVLN